MKADKFDKFLLSRSASVIQMDHSFYRLAPEAKIVDLLG
jgi:hypothetical protein